MEASAVGEEEGHGYIGYIGAYQAAAIAFAEERLSAQEFEAIWLSLFKNDPETRPPSVFQVLEQIFLAVDDYVPDTAVRAKVGGKAADQLRQFVVEHLASLLACTS